MRQRKETRRHINYTHATMKPKDDSRLPRTLSLRISMADLMATWPQAIPILLERRMACVGCDMARFETLADACTIYGIDPGRLLADLSRVIENSHTLEDR